MDKKSVVQMGAGDLSSVLLCGRKKKCKSATGACVRCEIDTIRYDAVHTLHIR